MATISASGGSGQVTVTGSGFSANEQVILTMDFSATGRRFNEMRQVIADGSGAVSTVLPVGFAGNTTIRARVRGTTTIAATSSQVAVT